MTQVVDARFKYTVAISKAEANDEGLYLYGEASGPEIDKQQERIDPVAIKAFAQQIKDRVADGNPIPYVDEHDKSTSGRGVLRHLGDVVDGGITETDHLWVKVRLNEKNPAATFLYGQIVDEGKQYGMSVQGSVLEFADEVVKSIGRKVRTFKNVVLDHIANTTRPVWTPSLGTVLNRAVTKALEDEGNGEEMAEEIVVESTSTEETTTPETPATTETTPVEVATATATETPSVEETPAVTGLEAKMDALINAFGTLTAALTPQTPAPATVERAEAETPEPVTTNDDSRFAALEAELAELKERSATPRPPVLTKAESDEFKETFGSLSPQERLRVGLAAMRGEDFS